MSAALLTAGGQTALALAQAQKSAAEAKGFAGERDSLRVQAVLLAASQQPKEADEVLAALVALTDPLTAAINDRMLAFARGQVALARHDFPLAVAELTKAQAALLPRGGTVIGTSLHVPIWFALGEAYVGAGRAKEAEPWFTRVTASGHEHAAQPLEYVRSFYHLGKIHEEAGDLTRAREAYRRFVGYWKDGDLDRERVAEAERKLRGQ